MPELPEVETIRRGLVRARIVAPIKFVWRSRARLRTGAHWARREEHLRELEGARPGSVKRRGKFLIWHCRRPGSPRADLGLVIHLGMSGVCSVLRAGVTREPHTHLVVGFADERELRFVDPRRFGGLHVGQLVDLERWGPLGELGPEPLSRAFCGATLEEALGRSRRTLRDGLLDQRAVAGIGNIYASEALFEAGLHPLLPARRLRTSAWERLAVAVVTVLGRAIAAGGTTLRDYRGVDGAPGRNRSQLKVYGRAGLPCPSCGTSLVGYVHQGRSGVFCPKDQARPRTRRIA